MITVASSYPYYPPCPESARENGPVVVVVVVGAFRLFALAVVVRDDGENDCCYSERRRRVEAISFGGPQAVPRPWRIDMYGARVCRIQWTGAPPSRLVCVHLYLYGRTCVES